MDRSRYPDSSPKRYCGLGGAMLQEVEIWQRKVTNYAVTKSTIPRLLGTAIPLSTRKFLTNLKVHLHVTTAWVLEMSHFPAQCNGHSLLILDRSHPVISADS